MKNIFYSLCLLIGITSWATSVDYHTLSLNINDIEKNSSESGTRAHPTWVGLSSIGNLTSPQLSAAHRIGTGTLHALP